MDIFLLNLLFRRMGLVRLEWSCGMRDVFVVREGEKGGRKGASKQV
jgi:hypothetical protein